MTQPHSMEQWWEGSYLSAEGAAYLEQLYETFLRDPQLVPAKWRDCFTHMGGMADVSHEAIRLRFARLAQTPSPTLASTAEAFTEHERKQVHVIDLCNAYQQRGHQRASIDPLDLWQRAAVPDLDLAYHQLSHADLNTLFQADHLFIGKDKAILQEIVDVLEHTYCRSIGVEFMDIVSIKERQWLQQRMESVCSIRPYGPHYSDDTKRHLLERLTAAEGLEKTLAAKYPGVKRFGLEGTESLIPMMDAMIQQLGSVGVKEIVMGMAHRGRLNVLVNILGKNPADLFSEFEGKAEYQGSSDVKYHQGFSSNVMTPGGEAHLALLFNPSHLEIVSPVVQGSVRARQDRRGDTMGDQVVPIVLHGDASFAGQGVVMETFQMSQLRGYKTGGTIRIVVNNQVGFTTGREDARSTDYCTDIAKMVQAPIFHVNADDPEAVLFVSQLAVEYRQTFKKDVVIDLVGYRRHGHNEADEPSGTQPLMYRHIRQHATARDRYAKRLIADGTITVAEDKTFVNGYRDTLESGEHVAKSLVKQPNHELFVDWTPYLGHGWDHPCDTRYALKRLKTLTLQANRLPSDFSAQRQVAKDYQKRQKMASGELPINWGFAEIAAYATLLDAGYPVRLTGQDVERGTFSHRHAVVRDMEDGSTYTPLNHLHAQQAPLTIYNSLLSEEAVMAFEYGYATTRPDGLVVWEAQYGDFANGAQVVIDQFISSAERKWQRLCGLVLLLPHGYEAQGPEHSSARLERYLQLCAEHNIQVCLPTTPTQIFHLLRRQVVRPLRRPLVIMSPKDLLRHKDVTSTLQELAQGQFQRVIDDVDCQKSNAIRRIILCSGRVYYDLRAVRRAQKLDHIAIIRLEQLYPFPEQLLCDVLSAYSTAEDIFWCQEEPMNQGAWYASQHHIHHVIMRTHPDLRLQYAGREASASPAAGYKALHVEQQEVLIAQALGINHS